jgi:hypothetical protein
MRIVIVALALLVPGVALADPPGHGWGLWVDRGGDRIALHDIRTGFAEPMPGRSPSIQAGVGWRGSDVAAVVGYDQPEGARPDAYAPLSNARYPGAPSAGSPGVMGLSVSYRLR